MAVTALARFADLDASTYQRHWLHDDDRSWPETNCYADLWIELLHALGTDPVAGLAFTLSVDFDGEQWEFFKNPLEDLRAMYGIDVHEMNLWRSIEQHIEDHLRLGRLLAVEADSWYLPDTAGVSYQLAHQKSTIAAATIDRDEQRLGYFHNRAFHELSGDDYRGALRVGASADVLPPYAELINLDGFRAPSNDELHAIATQQVRDHLRRRPTQNPLPRLRARIEADLAWLQSADEATFHGYAFGTLRQCGAWADTTATFVAWLEPDLTASIAAFSELSDLSKTGQFKLARAARGRALDVAQTFDSMGQCWDDGYGPLIDAFGP